MSLLIFGLFICSLLLFHSLFFLVLCELNEALSHFALFGDIGCFFSCWNMFVLLPPILARRMKHEMWLPLVHYLFPFSVLYFLGRLPLFYVGILGA